MDDSPSSPSPKRGRPRYIPQPKEQVYVEVLIANGVSLACIAEMLGIDKKTLKRAFRNELEIGHERIKARISGAVAKAAMSGHIGAAKFWLVMRGGEEWRLPKGDTAAAALNDTENGASDPWVIMMPPNGRDKPERDGDEPPPDRRRHQRRLSGSSVRLSRLRAKPGGR